MVVIKFKESPKDTISDILIKDQKIYISSWDNFIYLYDFNAQSLIHKIQNTSPILKMLHSENSIYSENLIYSEDSINFDNLIYADSCGNLNFYDQHKQNTKKIKFNLPGISTINTFKNMFIIGGYTNKLWLYSERGLFKSINLEDKVYNSLLINTELVLNYGNKIKIYDIRNFKVLREINNKKQIRTICIRENKLYIGDVEGKMKIHNLDTKEEIIINAHFEIQGNVKKVYPVNCIINEGNLYSCGSDGVVNKWKEDGKLKCNKIFKNKQGIIKMASYGERLVIGSGYNYENGVGETTENDIFMI
ncbi:mitotic checkpoint protein BUB3 [Vairimorpha necatrix]|uniref:Mitotic checkpoint protein BUB3 n=1 Tax=Vairimorpha necatrix TaxID=6039 RepID=A0AAX4JDT6_9MICR